MTDIQIEKNVSMPSKFNRAPKRRRSRPVKWNWPLAKMEIGDSIFVPITEFAESVQTGKDHITHHCNNAIRMQVIRETVSDKFKFASRQVFEGKNVIGARVWRTA